MIRSLVRFYDSLLDSGKVRFGYSHPNIDTLISIDKDGHIVNIIFTGTPSETGKGMDYLKHEMPAKATRGSNTKAQFLWDNPEYMLGLVAVKMEIKDETTDKTIKVKRMTPGKIQKFNATKELHQRLLRNIDIPAAKALYAFFDEYSPEKAASDPTLAENKTLLQARHISFRFADDGLNIFDYPEILELWTEEFAHTLENGPKMQCLVTGKIEHIPLTHDKMTKLFTSKHSSAASLGQGASLISFDKNAFKSYGFDQNENAPIGARSAFKYVAALNYMIGNETYHKLIGDRLNVLFWTSTGNDNYQKIIRAQIFNDVPITPEISAAMDRLLRGLPVKEMDLDPNTEFCIAGLTPNSGRNALKFFLKNTFGDFLKNVNEHYERLRIDTIVEQQPYLPIWRILRETTFEKDPHAAANPRLEEQILSAVLNNTPYPAALMNNVSIRIRAGSTEDRISPSQAAIIKAYYLKRPKSEFPQEILTVSLNPNSDNVAYNLGRLFAVYAELQRRAIGAKTVAARYYNSASNMPAGTFPTLHKLAQAYLNKLENTPRTKGGAVYLDRLIADIKDRLPENYPKHLTRTQANAFDLGYYHQHNDLFVKYSNAKDAKNDAAENGDEKENQNG